MHLTIVARGGLGCPIPLAVVFERWGLDFLDLVRFSWRDPRLSIRDNRGSGRGDGICISVRSEDIALWQVCAIYIGNV